MSTPRTFQCPAKVNLTLSVGAPQPDGYHPICSWMVRVSLFDDLRLKVPPPSAAAGDATGDAAGDGGPALVIDWSPDAVLPSPIDWSADQDLAVRAHQLVQRHVGQSLPISGSLLKRIPVGAGLAGGSSNGATMLQALDELFDLDLGDDTLRQLASELGSDPAFFLGPPAAIVSGVGEALHPAPLARPIDLVLILPALQCHTGKVYRAFDDVQPDAGVNADAVQQAAEHGVVSDDLLFNDLAEAAMTVEPQLREVHQRCADAAGRPVHVSGSGSGMFVLADDADDAARLAEHLRRDARVSAVAVRSLH